MTERPNVPVLKTGVVKATVGSNPTLSAKKRLIHEIGKEFFLMGEEVSSFSRKLKRKQDVASRKVAKKQFKSMVKSTMKMDKKCNVCSRDFNEVTKEEGLDWMVRYNGTAAEMQCPVCFSAQKNQERNK